MAVLYKNNTKDVNEILKTLGDIAEICGINKHDFYNQLKWAEENKNHPLIKTLIKAIELNKGDIKNGLQMALGIVVEHLSKYKNN